MTWPYFVFSFLDFSWFGLGGGCVALLVLLILRKDFALSVEKFAARSSRTSRALGVLGFLSLPVLLGLYNLARFKIYYLTADSGIMGNLTWNIAHGYGLTSMVLGGGSMLAVHFAFTVGLLAPFVRLWNSIGVLAIAQGAAVGSAPAALFLLARRRSEEVSVRWIVLLLVLAHPRFQELAGTVLDNSVYAFPFFVWAAYFFETDRPLPGILCALIALTAREEVPFMSFGAGLFLFFRGFKNDRRIGGFVMAASVILWLAEMRLIHHAQLGSPILDTWALFRHIGGSPEAILRRAISHPWELPLALVSPRAKLLPVFSVLSHAAFLPIISGAYFLPALVVWLPHQLADAGSNYQALHAHYSSFVLGPVLWAMLYGLIRRRRGLSAEGRRWLDAGCLAVAAWGFLGAGRFYDPRVHVIPSAWVDAAPKALAAIPPEAKVWCDGYLLPNLAMRRYVKKLPPALPDDYFETSLFVPDYVLLSKYWLKVAQPSVTEPVLRVLRERHYEVAFQEADLVLMANPRRLDPAGAPESLTLR